jgi:stage III sporulation protein AA
MITNNSSNMIPESIRSSLYGKVKVIVSAIPFMESKNIEEIRLKVGKPLMVHSEKGDFFVDDSGNLVRLPERGYIATEEEVKKTLELLCDSSIYAVQEELRDGYITVKGGHRIGIAGKVLLKNNEVYHIKDISSINIRIAKEIKGAADELINHVINGNFIYNTLLISPPQCGKTTMLRDLARLISNGTKNFQGIKVGIVDERSEIAACYKGVPQHDVGLRTDVLDGCPKACGIYMMLRSMSPQVIITDEIGSIEDIISLSIALNAGVKIITSVHGFNRQDILNRPNLRELIMGNYFEKIVVLSRNAGVGTLEEIWEMEKI